MLAGRENRSSHFRVHHLVQDHAVLIALRRMIPSRSNLAFSNTRMDATLWEKQVAKMRTIL